MKTVNVIGAGLAGCEAAWNLANNGIKVKLFEQKPLQRSAASNSDKFAELVCSNSLRAIGEKNAVGLLKMEMEKLGSIVMEAATQTAVPAGGALAVDREEFSKVITDKILSHPNIEIISEIVEKIDFEQPTIIATGPLTDEKLAAFISENFSDDQLYFFDAAAPVVNSENIDMNVVYAKSRYDKGTPDYLNIPLTEAEYLAFYELLTTLPTVELKDFELKVFESCMPVEVMAKRGIQTLLFGPMKPVGLHTPDGKRPHAVIQLRQDNVAKTLYNLVGFQTNLTWAAQKTLINSLPGMADVTVERFGVMHRNTYICAPKILDDNFQTKKYSNIFFAGQITGVEGYVESAASGIVAAIGMHRYLMDTPKLSFPRTTAIGSLTHYIANADENNFQPMHVNFGIIPELGFSTKKKDRKAEYAKRAIADFEAFLLEKLT